MRPLIFSPSDLALLNFSSAPPQPELSSLGWSTSPSTSKQIPGPVTLFEGNPTEATSFSCFVVLRALEWFLRAEGVAKCGALRRGV